jgi:hypothetical protein
MECSQIRAILFENTDTEIPVEFREGVEAHLAVCRSCAMQFEALREQSHALGTLPKVEAPGDFLAQIRGRVEKPSTLSRLKQGFFHLFAGKHFLKLAGAAATAVVVIVAAQVMLKDSGHQKALLPPAPAQVGSPRSIATPPPVAAPPASPGESGKVSDRAALPWTEPQRPAGVETQSVALTVKSRRVSSGGIGRGGSFKPEGFSRSGAGTTGIHAQEEKKLKADVSKRAAGTAEVSRGSPPPEAQGISSDVIRMIKRANGKILSAAPARDDAQPETLLAEMPATNYPSFLDQLRQLGEIEFNGNKEFSPTADANVRVSVSFDTSD